MWRTEPVLADARRAMRYWWESAKYSMGGSIGGGVPHVEKRRVVKKLARAQQIEVFVETGTYFGDMLFAMLPHFKQLYSIELSSELHARAAKRFSRYPHCQLIHGDSAQAMDQLLPGLTKPSLFWLDAHYSGGFTARAAVDPPISRELVAIFKHPIREHVVLIDDARLFSGTDGYPAVESLRSAIADCAPWYRMTIDRDIIRLLPARLAQPVGIGGG